jgi:hypothetical protein
MQTDEEAARGLAAASRGEAYNKQLELLLRRRKEAREAGTAADPSGADVSITRSFTARIDVFSGCLQRHQQCRRSRAV